MEQLPGLKLTLKPVQQGEKIIHMDVKYEINGLDLNENDRLGYIYQVLASIPKCEFSEVGLKAFDEQGELPLVTSEEVYQYGKALTWRTTRQSNGSITVNYRVYPRILPENYSSSPYFDLRTEQGGMNGAGVPFIVLLPEKDYAIHLHWDLEEMPEGARGIWCKGEGDVSLTGTPELLAYSYYAVGKVKTWRTQENEKFEFHWIAEPNFDVDAVAARIFALYQYFSVFFEDTESPFKIFARRDPFKKSGGGTALADSFMFGYSDEVIPTPDGMQTLMAHEMVHNWPHLDGDLEDRTWYAEGTAEYYSMVLPYRAGLSSLEKVMEDLQKKAGERYYANPFRSISMKEALKMSWKDRRTQVIPYGRGLVYMLKVNHEIRAVSKGKRSLDDIVLQLLRIERQEDRKPDVKDWLELAGQELGRDARPDYEAMLKGEMILPDDNWFGGVFKAKPAEVPQYVSSHEQSEETIDGFIWERNQKVPPEKAVI